LCYVPSPMREYAGEMPLSRLLQIWNKGGEPEEAFPTEEPPTVAAE